MSLCSLTLGQVGRLWCSLADYYIRLGHFEKARDIYEEAMSTVCRQQLVMHLTDHVGSGYDSA